ncbi:hypothetical protein QF001_008054 [Paraburkholderia youngii]
MSGDWSIDGKPWVALVALWRLIRRLRTRRVAGKAATTDMAAPCKALCAHYASGLSRQNLSCQKAATFFAIFRLNSRTTCLTIQI